MIKQNNFSPISANYDIARKGYSEEIFEIDHNMTNQDKKCSEN